MLDCVAVVGATGTVGTIIRQLLEAAPVPLPAVEVRGLGPLGRPAAGLCRPGRSWSRSCGRTSTACNWPSAARPTTWPAISFPRPSSRGCLVIDESGYWRMDPKVPLVIPEVNPQAIRQHQGIIASPNCSTTQMVQALKPLHDAGRVHRVVVSTYQATSGAGLAGTRDLEGGTRALLAGEALPATSASPTPSPSTAFRRSARPSTRATRRKK